MTETAPNRGLVLTINNQTMTNLSTLTKLNEALYFWGQPLNGELYKVLKRPNKHSNGVYETFKFFIEKDTLYLQIITDDGCDCGGRLFNRETYLVEDPTLFPVLLKELSEYCAEVN
jgi:hypothetical protein